MKHLLATVLIATLLLVAAVVAAVDVVVIRACTAMIVKSSDAFALIGFLMLCTDVIVTSCVYVLLATYGYKLVRLVLAGDLFSPSSSSMALLLLLSVFSTGCIGCERINAGHVGIKIELAGSARGVQDVPIVTGYVLYNPLTQNVFEYPTYVQTAVWARSAPESGGPNEELSFNDRDGVIMTADVSLSWQIQASRVPAFYVKFRSDDLDQFTHGYLRNVARDHLNEVGGTYSVEALYGPKKEEFLRAVRSRINHDLDPIGVGIEQLGFIGAPRPPQNVINAINAKIAATQAAMQAENELRTAEAEAKKVIATAEGDAKARIAKANGEAGARVAMAEGEAKANRSLAESVTPVLLQWRRLENEAQAIARWDGRRPTIEGQGSGGLLLQLPPLEGK